MLDLMHLIDIDEVCILFTLIIVHADPEWLQRLVEEMMPWRQHRVDKIVTAVDGPAALRAAIASRPELILSDSELHGASGADWVNEYAATGNPFQVAFFCAREDFGFARAAMRLKAVDCLPMPVTPAQLERTIADMIGELERPSGLNLQMWLNAQTLLQRSFADSLLQGTRFYSDQTFREHARSLRMEWLDEGCRVLAIRMTEDPSDATSAGERRLAAYAADNVIQELAGRHARSVIVTSGTGEWIYIAASEEPEADIGIVAEEWIEAVRQYTHARIRIGLSGRSARWNELPRLLSQAVEALSFADTLDGHSVLRYERTAAHMPETRGSDERRLLRELLAGNKAGVRQWLEDLPRDAFGPQDGVALAESAWKWLAGLHRFLESSGAMHGGGIDDSQLAGQLQDAAQANHVHERVTAHLLHLCDLLNPSTGEILQRAIDYIASNLASRVRLEDAAKQLFVSPVWLGRLFSSRMNRTFLQYVTALKMEEAKLRLRHSRSRVQDVARDLGYEDVVYFAKLFRRATGQSPSEYKNGLRMNG